MGGKIGIFVGESFDRQRFDSIVLQAFFECFEPGNRPIVIIGIHDRDFFQIVLIFCFLDRVWNGQGFRQRVAKDEVADLRDSFGCRRGSHYRHSGLVGNWTGGEHFPAQRRADDGDNIVFMNQFVGGVDRLILFSLGIFKRQFNFHLALGIDFIPSQFQPLPDRFAIGGAAAAEICDHADLGAIAAWRFGAT